MNIDNKWMQYDIATGTNRFPSDGESAKADGGKHTALVRMSGRREEKEKDDER